MEDLLKTALVYIATQLGANFYGLSNSKASSLALFIAFIFILVLQGSNWIKNISTRVTELENRSTPQNPISQTANQSVHVYNLGGTTNNNSFETELEKSNDE